MFNKNSEKLSKTYTYFYTSDISTSAIFYVTAAEIMENAHNLPTINGSYERLREAIEQISFCTII